MYGFPSIQKNMLFLQRIISSLYCLDRSQQQIRPFLHQTIMQVARRHLFRDRHLFLENNISGIYFMLQQESTHPGNLFPVHHCPIDRRCPPIIRQQRGMQIYRSQTRHAPYHFRQHLKRNHQLQVHFQSTQLFQKCLTAKPLRLQYPQTGFPGIFFYCGFLQLLSPSGRLVWIRNNPHDTMPRLHQSFQRKHRKIRRSHIYDSQTSLTHFLFTNNRLTLSLSLKNKNTLSKNLL